MERPAGLSCAFGSCQCGGLGGLYSPWVLAPLLPTISLIWAHPFSFQVAESGGTRVGGGCPLRWQRADPIVTPPPHASVRCEG